MSAFAEHREISERLPDFLPWYGLIGPVPGVVLQKGEILQKSFAFRGPDYGSAGMDDLIRLSGRLNAAFSRGGAGWTYFVEVQRLEAQHYPSSDWPDPASWLVDCERRQRFFSRANALFESHYFLTFAWRLPSDARTKLTRLFWASESGDVESLDVNRDVDFFLRQVQELCDQLLAEGGLKELIELDDAQTLTYLKSTISRNRHPVGAAVAGLLLDALLPDQALTCGETIMIGDYYMPTAVITQFPAITRPAMFAQLDALGFEYRVMTRWARMTKEEAQKELEHYRRSFWSKRVGLRKLLREQATDQPTALINNVAVNKSQDAASALEALGADMVSFGKETTTITTWDRNYAVAREKMRALKQILQGQGFVVRDETINNLQAWLGSLPGNTTANVRRFNISSINFAHRLPGATAVWSGDECNEDLRAQTGQALSHLYCATDDTTPFRFNAAVGDVGHVAMFGPTGAGKSFKLSTLALQWLRYQGAQVVILDKDRSSRAATMAVGGRYYEPGRADAPMAFQPFARIDDPNERLWAARFVFGLFAAQNHPVTPEIRDKVNHALAVLASKHVAHRRLFYFVDLLGDPTLALVLRPYTIQGAFGQIFDADHEDLAHTHWLMIEMGHLMKLGPEAVLPALAYLFHRIEQTFFVGRPTLLILDEAWLYLEHAFFADRLREWLKTLRKRHVYVIFATQEIEDALHSPILPSILSACETMVLLPNPKARQLAAGYRVLGLSEAEIDHLAQLQKKKHYLYLSPKARRVYTLDPGPVGLAFAGMSSKKDQLVLDSIEASVPPEQYAEAILRHRGLDAQAAQLAEARAAGRVPFTS